MIVILLCTFSSFKIMHSKMKRVISRFHRRCLSDTAAARLQRVWDETSVRVVAGSELGVCRHMEKYESVHVGYRDDSHPRSWLARLQGRHRLCFVLEHDRVGFLAYLLVSVSPYTASDMNSIFEDRWKDEGGQGVAASAATMDFKGEWKHCNFYSVTALNKDPMHPFHGVPVGLPCIAKGAEFLLKHGVRDTLARKRMGDPSDCLDASGTARAVLRTISPIPSLSAAVKAPTPSANTEEFLLNAARVHITERRDPVAKFHLGNGANLYRVNWNADDAEQRIKESYGIMANYDYDAVMIEREKKDKK